MNINVQVSRKVTVEIQPKSATAHVGSHMEFHCLILPPQEGITRTWIKDGHLLESRGRYSVTGATLTIYSIVMEDAGVYQCLVNHEDKEIIAAAAVFLGGTCNNVIKKIIVSSICST